MKVTIDGITYEGTEDEIRRIVENPPNRPPVTIRYNQEYGIPNCPPRNWDGSPIVTGTAKGGDE